MFRKLIKLLIVLVATIAIVFFLISGNSLILTLVIIPKVPSEPI